MDEPKNGDGIAANDQHPPETGHVVNAKSHDEIFYGAKAATAKEQKMTLWQGIKLYPKAVGWSILISTCICMEGYDLCLLSNFYGELGRT